MRLDLLSVLQSDGAELPFCFEQDLSALEICGQTPFPHAARVEGRVVKSCRRGGALELSMEVTVRCQSVCDRCGLPVSRLLHAPFSAFISEHAGDLDSEDTVFMDGHELDLEPLAVSAAVLEYPAKLLCREDCRGLCHRCGADLNEGGCECGKNARDSGRATLGDLF